MEKAKTPSRSRNAPSKSSDASKTPHQKEVAKSQSTTRAKSAFKDFSLSKFGQAALPANYVQRGQKSQTVQREAMQRQVSNIPDEGMASRTMTFALLPSTLQKLVPSFDQKKQSADLDQVLAVVKQNMRGTEFIANGDPTIKRLAIQARVDTIINNILGGGK